MNKIEPDPRFFKHLADKIMDGPAGHQWEGEVLWGEIDSDKTFNTLFQLYKSGAIEELNEGISVLSKHLPVLPILLIGTKLNVGGYFEDFRRWLVQQRHIFPTSQKYLDLGLRTSLFKYLPYGVELFVELGAEPNQVVLEERTLLDIAVARCDFGYTSQEEGELDRTVDALLNAGGKHYLELTASKNMACESIFSHIPLYDSWSETVVTDLLDSNPHIQEQYSELFIACLVKSQKPSKKWWDKVIPLIDEIGRDNFLQNLSVWLTESCKPRKSLKYGFSGGPNYYRISYMEQAKDYEIWMISNQGLDVLKSLLWLTTLMNTKDRVSLLNIFTIAMFTTYHGYGIRSPKLANQSFELMIQEPMGKQIGLEMIEKCDHKPSIKRMNAAFEKLNNKS
jgi:hypothetical protein